MEATAAVVPTARDPVVYVAMGVMAGALADDRIVEEAVFESKEEWKEVDPAESRSPIEGLFMLLKCRFAAAVDEVT